MTRVVVIGAGGPAGLNVCRALQTDGWYVVAADTNPYHLALARRWSDETILTPTIDNPAFAAAVTAGLSSTDDVIHAQPEQAVRWVATHRPARTLTPTAATINWCQDKAATAGAWWRAGLRQHETVLIGAELPDWLNLAADKLGLPFWLRATRGAGARGATLATTVAQAYHWIRYWAEHGTRDIIWSAEEYLPGRDFCWTSVWRDGTCYAAFARERIEWMYPHLTPTGRTGTPTVAVTVHDQRVNTAAETAVRTIDPNPHGIYAVDLRENRDGTPTPTEINAGRWPTTSPLYHELGPNLPDLHARLALGENPDEHGQDIYPAGVYLIRHIDGGHRFATADMLLGQPARC